MEEQPRSDPWAAVVFLQPGCVLVLLRAQGTLVDVLAMSTTWKQRKHPRVLSVIPRAARVGINPKITPWGLSGPDNPGWRDLPSPLMSPVLDRKVLEDQRADPGVCSTTAAKL